MKFVGHRLCKTYIAIGVFLAAAGHGMAQTPAAPTPGSVLDTLPGTRPALPSSPAQIIIPDQPGPTVHDRRGARFQVHSFRFIGNTVYLDQRLKQVVNRYLDMEVNLYDLNVAADAVTEFYRDRGYTLARAVIPPQKVEDGVVTLAVIEGRLGKVLFSGNKRYSEATLRAHTPMLQPGVLVTTERLERDLLLLNDMPGLKVRSALSPGARFGDSDVLVKTEEKLWGLNINTDNAGRKETGRMRVDVAAELNNPLGYGDQLTVRAMVTDRQLMTYQKVGYNFPLAGNGLRMSLAYSDVQYDVAGAFAALNLGGSATSWEAALQYPLTRSRGKTEMVNLTYRQTTIKQRVFGTEISSVELPIVVAGYQRNIVGDDASVTNLSFTAASNFNKNSSGLEQNAELFRFEADANYLLPLNRRWDVYLRGNTVWSSDRLPDSEKFSIGGPGSVRGYRSSELRGDSGWQGTVEFRRNFAAFGMPASASMFYDAGRVIYKFPGFANGWDSLGSGGVGLTLYPFPQTVLKLEAATRLAGGRYEASDQQRGRVWLSLATSF